MPCYVLRDHMQNLRKTRRSWPIGSRAALGLSAFNLRYDSVPAIRWEFKADQFAQQGIVSRISIAAPSRQSRPIELTFRFGKSGRPFLSDDTSGNQSISRDHRQACRCRVSGPTLDRPGHPHQRFAWKPGKQVICFHRKIPKPRVYAATAISAPSSHSSFSQKRQVACPATDPAFYFPRVPISSLP